jgi:hypothetical protein
MENFNEGQKKTSSKPLNLLIIDRRIDLVSPLVRNFYYLNMISDIFAIDFNQRNLTLKEGK